MSTLTFIGRLSTASLLLLYAVLSPGIAADLPRKLAKTAPQIEISSDWSGWYAGLNGGAGWGATSQAGAGSWNQRGGFVGGSFGYNWQSERFVLGIEGDLDWYGITGRSIGPSCFGSNCVTNLNWLSTVRPRAGYAVGNFLPYLTAGVAVGQIDSRLASVGLSSTRVGWSVGGGIETVFSPNWSTKFEYLHFDLGTSRFDPAVTSEKADLIRLSVNYRFLPSIFCPFWPFCKEKPK